MTPNAAERHESGQVYGVDARYRKKWRLIGWAGIAAAVALVLLGLVVAGAGDGPMGVTLAIFGILIFGGMVVLIFGVNRTSENDSLVVSADGLTVNWHGRSTVLPWSEVDHWQIAQNSPVYRALEVHPRPGAQLSLPAAGWPRASKRNPGMIEVFILSVLGDRQAECVAGITGYLKSRS